MTTTATPELAARRACRTAGIAHDSLTHLHHHATAVFLLPTAGIVVRVSPSGQLQRLRTAIKLTRWLLTHDFPATEPVDLAQPVLADQYVVTFWKHYPQVDRGAPDAGHLGALLRTLHDLPPCPLTLPEHRPLSSLTATMATSTSLSEQQHQWLTARIDDLLASYEQLDFPLGRGLLHGDAYPGNTLWDGTAARLGDWDEAAFGPRELDLANTFQGIRYGRTDEELTRFARRYGYDVRQWSGLPVLRHIRDLHTLGSYIRRADAGDTAAIGELTHRIATLQAGADDAMWAAL
jgi:aminoglycoside phosphotransferase (APT) family kinase protein